MFLERSDVTEKHCIALGVDREAVRLQVVKHGRIEIASVPAKLEFRKSCYPDLKVGVHAVLP